MIDWDTLISFVGVNFRLFKVLTLKHLYQSKAMIFYGDLR